MNPVIGGVMRRRVSVVLVAAFLLTYPFSSASAQAVYGSIAGTVADPSGGVLPGVTVTITSLARKTGDSVVTNEAGQFVKDRLLPGTYEVKVELSGFKQSVYSDIQVNVDAQTRLDVRLQVGAMSEAVTVTGFSPLLKTDRADVATTFETRQLTDLPVLDRNFTKFVLLTPGTQQLGWQHAASENPQGSTQTMVNGQHFSGTGYQLDGTENRDPILGIIVINPTLESIAETKITSQNYDAEFGQATAGVVSVQTKSGANQMRGSGFLFHQDERLQARNPFTQFRPDPLTGKFLPETSKRQFGASLGGRIVENRWFFFGDYEGTRNTVGGSRLVTYRPPPRAPAISAPTESTSTTPPPALRRRGSSSRTTGFRPDVCRHRRSRFCSACRSPTSTDARTEPSTTSWGRDRRPSTATRSTCGSTAASAMV